MLGQIDSIPRLPPSMSVNRSAFHMCACTQHLPWTRGQEGCHLVRPPSSAKRASLCSTRAQAVSRPLHPPAQEQPLHCSLSAGGSALRISTSLARTHSCGPGDLEFVSHRSGTGKDSPLRTEAETLLVVHKEWVGKGFQCCNLFPHNPSQHSSQRTFSPALHCSNPFKFPLHPPKI